MEDLHKKHEGKLGKGTKKYTKLQIVEGIENWTDEIQEEKTREKKRKEENRREVERKLEQEITRVIQVE